jgi:hypothetical protein
MLYSFPTSIYICCSPHLSDPLWDQSSLLVNGVLGFLYRDKSGRGLNLTTHLQLVLRLRMSGVIPVLPYIPSLLRLGQVLPLYDCI